MAVRVLAELIIGLALFVAILVAAYRFSAGRAPAAPARPELDVSRTPSTWYTDSRAVGDDHTEVGIVRVDDRTGLIRERRVLARLDNTAAGYSAALDEAMDEAYAAMRVANVNLHRR